MSFISREEKRPDELLSSLLFGGRTHPWFVFAIQSLGEKRWVNSRKWGNTIAFWRATKHPLEVSKHIKESRGVFMKESECWASGWGVALPQSESWALIRGSVVTSYDLRWCHRISMRSLLQRSGSGVYTNPLMLRVILNNTARSLDRNGKKWVTSPPKFPKPIFYHPCGMIVVSSGRPWRGVSLSPQSWIVCWKFKKGFLENYRVQLTLGKLYTLCGLEKPACGVL